MAKTSVTHSSDARSVWLTRAPLLKAQCTVAGHSRESPVMPVPSGISPSTEKQWSRKWKPKATAQVANRANAATPDRQAATATRPPRERGCQIRISGG